VLLLYFQPSTSPVNNTAHLLRADREILLRAEDPVAVVAVGGQLVCLAD
jgi:hypothetical protein